MSLVLPPAVQAQLDTESHAAIGRALDRALKQHDPDLGLCWIKSTIPQADLPAGAIPGRWHVRQRLHALRGGDRFYPITTPDGSYREPDFGVLQEMQARDLRARGLPDPRLDPLKDGPSRGAQLKEEQRRDELRADFKTAKRVAGDGGLTKRKWGKGVVGH